MSKATNSNKGENEPNSASSHNQSDQPFFKNVDSSITSPKSDEKRVDEMNELLDFIKKSQPISLWDLSKKTGIPNSTLYYKLRDMTFAGLIYSKIIITPQNRTKRLIYSAKKGGSSK